MYLPTADRSIGIKVEWAVDSGNAENTEQQRTKKWKKRQAITWGHFWLLLFVDQVVQCKDADAKGWDVVFSGGKCKEKKFSKK